MGNLLKIIIIQVKIILYCRYENTAEMPGKNIKFTLKPFFFIFGHKIIAITIIILGSMITVLEAIKLSTEFFEKKGIESPRANAEILLAHILKCKRLDLYLSFDKPLKDDELSVYREYLKRRGKFEPLQYILGEIEFYGAPFKIKPPVLIPRQETEILIETILSVFEKDNYYNFMDIGTGSGIIPVTLAMHFPNAKFTAIDINESALELAKANAHLNGVSERIQFLLKDILQSEPVSDETFNVIVSNPPYVSLEEYKTLQPEILNYESLNAVTDNSDGFTYYRTISQKSQAILSNDGYLFYEIGKGQSEEVKKIMEINCFEDVTIKKDYLNIDRVIFGVKH